LSIFPWQAGHQQRLNVSIYGLVAAFPGRIQPALLRFYWQISRIWHYWLRFLDPEELMDNERIREWINENESPEHETKRRKVVDSATQVTPKKESAILDIKIEDFSITKSLIRKAKDAVESRRQSVKCRDFTRFRFGIMTSLEH
jgi:hypothetical protein